MMNLNINKTSVIWIILVLFASVLLAACSTQAANNGMPAPQRIDTPVTPAPPTSGAGDPADVSFSKDVMPIFQSACINCHGGEKTSKGLDLKTFDSLMVGSQNGPVVVAGDPSGSRLIQSIESGKMPKRGPKLTPEQIQILATWVNLGAKNN